MNDEKIFAAVEDASIAPTLDVVAMAGAEALAATEALDTLPPNERVRYAIERAVARTYHESRKGEVAAAIREFSRVTSDLLRRYEYSSLKAKTDAFGRDMMMLEIRAVPPPPTEREIWEPRLRRATYGSEVSGIFGYAPYIDPELDSLWRFLQPDEKITGFDAWQVTTTNRTITRREIRLAAAPRYKVLLPDWSPEQFLRENFSELPRRIE